METRDKCVLVTGCCGTVGSELVRQLLVGGQHQPAEVLGIDNNESALFLMDQLYLDDPRARFTLADIRDRDKLLQLARGVDLIFHTAGLKHVVMCERSPMDAVQTNILGVENVIRAARESNVGKVIFTSSDKAVNPTNVMGTSKLMAERLITAAHSSRRGDSPIFASTRFGNVLGSSGSVVPVFRRQIAAGGPVTVTDERMTRFIMSVEQSVKLVIDTADLARGGEVFVTKMPVIRIVDLAKVMINELAARYGHDPDRIKIKLIGRKPGEKLYEELMSNEETSRAIELLNHFSITPAFTGLYHHIKYDYKDTISHEVEISYNSSHEKPLNRTAIKEFLNINKLLDESEDGNEAVIGRYWPGDKEERLR